MVLHVVLHVVFDVVLHVVLHVHVVFDVVFLVESAIPLSRDVRHLKHSWLQVKLLYSNRKLKGNNSSMPHLACESVPVFFVSEFFVNGVTYDSGERGCAWFGSA